VGLRVVFFGTPSFARTVLQGLLDSPHEVIAVATAPDRPSGRGRKVRSGPVSALARDAGMRLLQPRSLRAAEVHDELRALGADAFAVASYGLIFPEAALAIPRFGALNAHGSVLPLLRGAAPIERAILAGFSETGISIQRMVRRVDAGDVYAAGTTEIRLGESAGELRERLAAIAADLLPEVLTAVETGAVTRSAQNEDEATLAPPLEPHERAIVWTESAEMIARRIRAFAPDPGAFALLPEQLGRKRVKILAADPEPADNVSDFQPGEVVAASAREGLVVAAQTGTVELKVLKPEGKREMDATAFLSGHHAQPGQRFLDGMPSCPLSGAPAG
jgi:methionyl-tRNA formyltransferase